ncbi:MAG: hypothetical protein RMK60_04600 [Burkholderiales bacterium]|nr:hypothetical protein [Burkholderiales bacterium]
MGSTAGPETVGPWSADTLAEILQAGVLAPSADNRHPIRFELEGQTVSLRRREGMLPPPGGYRRVLELLSLGAVLENIAVAAARHSMAAVIHLFPDPARPDLLCRLGWSPRDGGVEPLWEQIPLRTTNRRLIFRGPALDPEAKASLLAALQPGCHLHWLDAAAVRSRALRLVRLAETERFRNRVLHADLFAGIRFDVGWQRSCDEGLPPGALGVERPLRPAFERMRYWPVIRLLNLLGTHWLLGLRAAWLPCRLAPHLGVIAVDVIDDASVVAAGRSFENLWLRTTALGMALQPLPASALYALEGAMHEAVPETLNRLLRAGWQALLPGQRPLMLFRLGRAAAMPVRTGRSPLDHFLQLTPQT